MAVFSVSDTWWFAGFFLTAAGVVVGLVRWYIAEKTRDETTRLKKEARRIRKDVEEGNTGRAADGAGRLEKAGEDDG